MKNESARKPNADLVNAFGDYVVDHPAGRFHPYPKDVFPIAAGIGIPINPTGFWLDRGKLKVMWVQKWKLKTLDDTQRSIFHTILDRRVFVGDDFGGADLEWIDLSAPTPRGDRSLRILNRKDFDTLSDAELKQHMDVLLEAFMEFAPERDARRAERREKKKSDQAGTAPPLFKDIGP